MARRLFIVVVLTLALVVPTLSGQNKSPLLGARTVTEDQAAGSSPRLPERIAINDNRVAAGTLAGGTLTIRLEARVGEWHPDGDADSGVVVKAFGR